MTGGKVVTYCSAWSDSACKVLSGWCSGCKAGTCKEMNKRIKVNELIILKLEEKLFHEEWFFMLFHAEWFFPHLN